MEQTIIGTIENIFIKEGVNKAGKPYEMTTLTIQGIKYSSFGRYEFNEGDKIQLVVIQNGQYWNFKSPILLEECNPSVPVEMINQRVASPATNKDNLKFDVVCVTNDRKKFVELVNAFNDTHDVKFTQTHVYTEGSENPNVIEYKVTREAHLFFK